VVEILRELAQHLKAGHGQIQAVYLFGSFAAGTATPRSDADIVVEVTGDADTALCERVADSARAIFAKSPVPTDVFVLTEHRMRQRRGVAGAVARQGLKLA
jgi:predicted nucleotidyltransferase